MSLQKNLIHETPIEPIWAERMVRSAQLKKAAAAAVVKAGMIRPFDHIFIDCGSTFAYLAEEIFAAAESLFPLTIYTTNAEVFQRYLNLPNRDLLDLRLIGGRYVPHHQSFDGSGFAMPHNAPTINRAFIGACPLDSQFRVMGSITDVVAIKRLIIRHASEIVIVCDESKLADALPGSRCVGRLVFGSSGELSLVLGDTSELGVVNVAAKLIIGVTHPSPSSGALKDFMERVDAQNLVTSDKVILANSSKDE